MLHQQYPQVQKAVLSCVDGVCFARKKCVGCAVGQYSPVSGLWSQCWYLLLALMGSANLFPIGDANLRVQDKARDFRFSDDRTCHHGIRLAIRVFS
ncbi:hypothetical protein, partial [Tritonibacter multivorans]|uniref:hypothetical protein n=1 Tax=Tritonibacter multivorans TaxID=928856 RepID=UPI001A93F9BA